MKEYMSKLTLSISVIALIFSVIAMVSCCKPHHGPHHPGPKHGGPRDMMMPNEGMPNPSEIFKMIDKNQDGIITEDEFVSHHEEMKEKHFKK